MADYDHKKIESEMQKLWETEGLYATGEIEEGDKKRYVLGMFPYPSGAGLHVGHVEGYTATDIYARFSRMNGFSVLHPMGWDAFGLPAENYAVKTGVPPQETTDKAIDNFRSQIKSIGISYDWSREVNTSSPEYYRWTQWIFLLLYKNGLAYKKKALVNWCPSCQTVLANEQVVDGECERCGAKVEKKELAQWFFNITNYAEELISGLEKIDWPESTKRTQLNWIGKSEGAEITFPIDKKFHYVLLHGYKSSPEQNFFPWLKSELERRGHTVDVPELPQSANPDVNEQVAHVTRSVNLTENTIIVAHSLGSIVAQKILEELPHPIHKLVLVGGFIDKEISSKRDFLEKIDFAFDTEKIKKNARHMVFLRASNDTSVPRVQADKLERAYGGEIIDFIAEKNHAKGGEEPEVLKASLESITVFTTRADTLFGATYMVIAPEHSLIEIYAQNIKNIKSVRDYVTLAKSKADIERGAEGKEKTGIKLEGLQAINPGSKETIPIFVADYVLPSYGTGAIMAVPAHDERDFEFANKFSISIKEVIDGASDVPRSEYGGLINSGSFTGLTSQEAKEKITSFVQGKLKTTYRLRDWLVSRQRYWGAPIPIVYDPEGNPHPIPEEELPWMLPTDVDFNPKGTSPLGSSKELRERTERIFGKGWTPEFDTCDTFVDSSWYYFRFIDPKNTEQFANKEKLKKWLPVDVYIGGAEHTVLHLLYARFFTKVLRDLGYVSINEPFQKLRHQGMILDSKGDKMSKSKGNIINPDEMVDRFGADTFRMYEMFMSPFEQSKMWSTDNMVGVRRFLEKVWRLFEKVNADAPEDRLLLATTIKKVTSDIESFQFNTAVSALMICANSFEKKESISKIDFSHFLQLLAPLAPHIADSLWRSLGHDASIHLESWPKFSEEELLKNEETYAVQVNGKVRDSLTVPTEMNEEDIVTMARSEKVEKWIQGQEIKKTIIVKGKIINFVV